MKVSVVIAAGRAAGALRRSLCALRLQTHGALEVLVVGGAPPPEWPDALAVPAPAGANLAGLRNLGLRRASGEVVAFLAAGAAPEPHWLAELLAGYDVPEVAGVGGGVCDESGAPAAAGVSLCDRRGQPCGDVPHPVWAYLLPRADVFVQLAGATMSFRRHLLCEVGGFDEALDTSLHESDVCVRLID